VTEKHRAIDELEKCQEALHDYAMKVAEPIAVIAANPISPAASVNSATSSIPISGADQTPSVRNHGSGGGASVGSNEEQGVWMLIGIPTVGRPHNGK